MSTSPAVLSPNPNPNTNGWTVVDRSRRRNRSGSTSGDRRLSQPQPQTLASDPPTLDPTPWTPMDPIIDFSRSASILRKIQSTIDLLEKSKFYKRFISRLNGSGIRDGLVKIRVSESGLSLLPIRLVAYGIGSIELYPAPQLQLALITLLRRQLGADVASAEVFDPVMSATECHVVEQLGFKVVTTNEHGCRKVGPETPTLFFMPHCEAVLYNSLLRTNWHPTNLRRMVVIGNSFREYVRYVSEAGNCVGSVIIEKVARCVLESTKFAREVEVELELGREETELGLFQAFHDTCWHFFDVNDDSDLFKVNC
ncbi:Protein SENSITIVITY TO RED LIGHT REDUCED 1 [Rhynchospora pubera]|uniref:Protein SENSITIVITY TO RED LIGHT REDUCED 1 n=1 Tax=Rhynchospora pubera TaxID=906938 RepID=A0AAV8E2U4_9POAL|nr:Protein SENSITIVITY TO RED LIGHT REDUCED 1 [Rhynchospora pubera]